MCRRAARNPPAMIFAFLEYTHTCPCAHAEQSSFLSEKSWREISDGGKNGPPAGVWCFARAWLRIRGRPARNSTRARFPESATPWSRRLGCGCRRVPQLLRRKSDRWLRPARSIDGGYEKVPDRFARRLRALPVTLAPGLPEGSRLVPICLPEIPTSTRTNRCGAAGRPAVFRPLRLARPPLALVETPLCSVNHAEKLPRALD